MFIPASALLAMHSTYIGQLMQPAAASLIVRMCIHLGGVAIVMLICTMQCAYQPNMYYCYGSVTPGNYCVDY